MSVSTVTTTTLPAGDPCPHTLVSVAGVVGQTITLRRVWDGQSAPVRGALNAPVLGSTMEFWDWEAPFGVEVSYRAEVVQSGSMAMAQSTPIVLAVTEWWISDPLSPRVSMRVAAMSPTLSQLEYQQETVISSVLGSPVPLSMAGTQQEASSIPVRFRAYTSAERLASLAVLRSASPLLIRRPATETRLPPLAYVTKPTVSVSDVDTSAGGDGTQIDFTATIVRPPAASIVVPVRTYQNDLDEDSSYSSSLAAKPTYAIRRRGGS